MTVGRRAWVGKRFKSPSDKLLSYTRVDLRTGCWMWVGARKRTGYGVLSWWEDGRKRARSAHVAMWELYRGPVPRGLELDHLCRVRNCVNPKHLEPVTRLENMRRGVPARGIANSNGRKTHCPRGHPYSGDNLYLWAGDQRRRCRKCAANRARDWRDGLVNTPSV